MQVIRKQTANLQDIEEARQASIMILQKYAGENENLRPKIEIPEPVYEEFSYGFKLRNLQSYFLEQRNPPHGEVDIIANIAYEGQVRIKYDPLIESQLNLYLSLEA